MPNPTIEEIESVDPAPLAKSVAADIRKHGHYRGEDDVRSWSPVHPRRRCCVFMNPTVGGPDQQAERDAIGLAVLRKVYPGRDFRYSEISMASEWQDKAGTEKTLEVLDAIAAGK